MPTYEYNCPGCGQDWEITCSMSDRNEQNCECGERLSRSWRSAPALVGPMPTKPTRIGGTDVSFSRAEDLRNYEKFQEKSGRYTLSRSDSEWRNMVDSAKEKANKMVKKAGFNDHEHFKRETRKARRRGGNLLKGG